jgi:hypothetical protein
MDACVSGICINPSTWCLVVAVGLTNALARVRTQSPFDVLTSSRPDRLLSFATIPMASLTQVPDFGQASDVPERDSISWFRLAQLEAECAETKMRVRALRAELVCRAKIVLQMLEAHLTYSRAWRKRLQKTSTRLKSRARYG